MQLIDIGTFLPVAIVRLDKYIDPMNNATAAGAKQTPDVEIAERILQALGDKNLSQESLAQEIGTSYSTLRRGLEQHRGDRRSFTVLELGRIATALGVHPSALLPATLTRAVAA